MNMGEYGMKSVQKEEKIPFVFEVKGDGET
jgi:hypothetical protein